MSTRNTRLLALGLIVTAACSFPGRALPQSLFSDEEEVPRVAGGLDGAQLERLVTAAGATWFRLDASDDEGATYSARLGDHEVSVQHNQRKAFLILHFFHRQNGEFTKAAGKLLKKWNRKFGDVSHAAAKEFPTVDGPETIWGLDMKLDVSDASQSEFVTGMARVFAGNIERFLEYIGADVQPGSPGDGDRPTIDPPRPTDDSDDVPGEFWMPTDVGVFHIVFPRAAECSTTTSKTNIGEVTESEYSDDDMSAKRSYRLIQKTFPAGFGKDADLAKEFPAFAKGVAFTHGGEPVDAKSLTVGGHPAYQFAIRDTARQRTVGHVRLIWAGSTLFQLMVYGQVEDGPTGSDREFLESLQTVEVDRSAVNRS